MPLHCPPISRFLTRLLIRRYRDYGHNGARRRARRALEFHDISEDTDFESALLETRGHRITRRPNRDQVADSTAAVRREQLGGLHTRSDEHFGMQCCRTHGSKPLGKFEPESMPLSTLAKNALLDPTPFPSCLPKASRNDSNNGRIVSWIRLRPTLWRIARANPATFPVKV